MAKEWSKSFYSSQQWQTCRKAFLNSKFYLCKRCKDYGNIAHHKKYLTPDNIDNPDITLNWDNLECLCQDCHNKEHHKEYDAVVEGLMFDSTGQIVKV